MNIDFYRFAEISKILRKRFGEKVMCALVASLSVENLIKLAADL